MQFKIRIQSLYINVVLCRPPCWSSLCLWLVTRWRHHIKRKLQHNKVNRRGLKLWLKRFRISVYKDRIVHMKDTMNAMIVVV